LGDFLETAFGTSNGPPVGLEIPRSDGRAAPYQRSSAPSRSRKSGAGGLKLGETGSSAPVRIKSPGTYRSSFVFSFV